MYFRTSESRAGKAPSQNRASLSFFGATPHVYAEPHYSQAQLPSIAARADAGPRRGGHDFAQVRIHDPSLETKSLERAVDVHGMGRIGWGQGQPVRFDPRRDPRLPIHTPAWTRRGTIHVDVPALFMPPTATQRMLRHEAIHSLHQQLAPLSESTKAHERAERMAAQGEQHFSAVRPAALLSPAPALLAFPPLFPPRPDRPWDKVWVGRFGLILEIGESGVPVRIYKRYDDLGITPQISAEEISSGKLNLPSLQGLPERMRLVAKKAAQMNDKIPATATAQRVAIVTIWGTGTSYYAVANGRGLIVLTQNQFEAADFEDTVAHEASHAIFEFHSVREGPPKKPGPDALALRIADLYLRLRDTKKVPIPTKKFDPKDPPSLAEATDGQPVGIVMVMDTLWAGSGGHPRGPSDEFFASAYAGFVQNEELLRQIIAYYQQADLKIAPLAEELFTLLDLVDEAKEWKTLKKPKLPKAAQSELVNVGRPADKSPPTGYELDWLIDPNKMPKADPRETPQ